MTELTKEQLQEARDIGAATYLSAYVHLMTRQLGLGEAVNAEVNQMAMPMVPALNIATEAIWNALMQDHMGVDRCLNNLRAHLEAM